jgi:hypothetical protein
VNNVLNEGEEYVKKYKIENLDDFSDTEKINFFYYLLKYIIKNELYVYDIKFLFNTQKQILKLIKAHGSTFFEKIKKNINSRDKIEYVLRHFIPYDYYLNALITNQNKSLSNSFQSEPYFQTVQNNQSDSKENNSNILSHESVKEAKNKSGRSFPIEVDFDTPDKNYSNEIAYQIMKKSTFTISLKSGNEKNIINYEEISYCDEKKKEEIHSEIKNIKISEIKELSSKNETVRDKYSNFLNYLEDVENTLVDLKKIKEGMEIKIKLQISIEEKNGFNVNSKFELLNNNIFNETTFKDSNILESKKYDGLYSLRDVINNSECT